MLHLMKGGKKGVGEEFLQVLLYTDEIFCGEGAIGDIFLKKSWLKRNPFLGFNLSQGYWPI